MSFLEQRTAAEKFGAVFGIVAVVIALRVFWNMGAFDTLVGRNTPDAIISRMEAQMDEVPLFASAWRAMGDHFPQDQQVMRDVIVTATQERGQMQDGVEAGMRFVHQFQQQHIAQFRAAPDASILAARDAAVHTTEMLVAQDTILCAHYLITGLRPDDHPTLEVQQAMGEAMAAQIAAIAAGAEMPVERPQPSQADAQAYGDVLVNMGVPPRFVDDMFRGSYALMAESAEVQCDSASKLFLGLNALPDEQSARLGAMLLLPERP